MAKGMKTDAGKTGESGGLVSAVISGIGQDNHGLMNLNYQRAHQPGSAQCSIKEGWRTPRSPTLWNSYRLL